MLYWVLIKSLIIFLICRRYDFKIQGIQLSKEEQHHIRVSRILTFLDWIVNQKQIARFPFKLEQVN